MDILFKLRNKILQGANNESDVLYVLAEIRKYLDRSDSSYRSKYPNMYFYCNLVVHHKLDRKPAVEILRRFESYFDQTKTIKENAKK